MHWAASTPDRAAARIQESVLADRVLGEPSRGLRGRAARAGCEVGLRGPALVPRVHSVHQRLPEVDPREAWEASEAREAREAWEAREAREAVA